MISLCVCVCVVVARKIHIFSLVKEKEMNVVFNLDAFVSVLILCRQETGTNTWSCPIEFGTNIFQTYTYQMRVCALKSVSNELPRCFGTDEVCRVTTIFPVCIVAVVELSSGQIGLQEHMKRLFFQPMTSLLRADFGILRAFICINMA